MSTADFKEKIARIVGKTTEPKPIVRQPGDRGFDPPRRCGYLKTNGRECGKRPADYAHRSGLRLCRECALSHPSYEKGFAIKYQP